MIEAQEGFYPYVYIGETRKCDLVTFYLKYHSKGKGVCVRFGVCDRKTITIKSENYTKIYALVFNELVLLNGQFKGHIDRLRMEYREADRTFYQVDKYLIENKNYKLAMPTDKTS